MLQKENIFFGKEEYKKRVILYKKESHMVSSYSKNKMAGYLRDNVKQVIKSKHVADGLCRL